MAQSSYQHSVASEIYSSLASEDQDFELLHKAPIHSPDLEQAAIDFKNFLTQHRNLNENLNLTDLVEPSLVQEIQEEPKESPS